MTAPLHGFRDAEDYYRRSSSKGFVAAIRTPTLLLHSTDDPFLPPECIPRQAAAQNRHLFEGFSARGGHVGFVAGMWPWRSLFWAEREATEFVADRLQAG